MRLIRLVSTALALIAGATMPSAARAQQQGVVIPEHATAQCGDGTWSMASNQRGACSSHQGVKHWIGRRPANASARCNDGEYWTNPTAQGACSSHGGVYKTYKAAEKAERKEEKKEMKAEKKAEKKEKKAEKKEMKAEKKAAKP
jgi:hypothetical protein